MAEAAFRSPVEGLPEAALMSPAEVDLLDPAGSGSQRLHTARGGVGRPGGRAGAARFPVRANRVQ